MRDASVQGVEQEPCTSRDGFFVADALDGGDDIHAVPTGRDHHGPATRGDALLVRQHDAVAVGVPDDKFGEAVTAVVEPEAGAEVDEAEAIALVREHLAAYKSPKRMVTIETIGRALPARPSRRIRPEVTWRAMS